MIANCLFRLVELLLEEQSNTSTAPGGENLFDAHTQVSKNILSSGEIVAKSVIKKMISFLHSN